MALQKRYYYGKALALIKAIEEIIGFDKETELVLDGSKEGIFLDVFENSSLAIAYFLSGKKNQAKKLLASIRKHIGFDSKTGFIYNKKGLSKEEDKKVLPWESTIYLSNQALLSFLYWLFEEREKSKEFLNKIDNEIGTFKFQVVNKTYDIYKHGLNQEYFYSFNNILVAIIKFINGDKEKSKRLVKDILEICFDKEMGLLRVTPEEEVYFLLDNSLLVSYYYLSGEIEKAEKLMKLIEEKIGFDNETKLAYRGIRGNKVIKEFLTYNNSHLAISYLCLGGMF